MNFTVKNDTKFGLEHNTITGSLPFSLPKWLLYFTDQIRIVRLLNRATLRHLCLTSSSNNSVKIESMSSENFHEKLFPSGIEVDKTDELNTCARDI